MSAFKKLQERGKGAIQTSIMQEEPKSNASTKAEMCFMRFVSSFLNYNYQLQIAISPRSLTQIRWNKPC